MKFNLTYGPDIASAPDGFKATVEAVAAFFESTFTDPVTINVKVERGLSGGLLGHSDYALTGPYTFAQITTTLAQETHSGSDVIALAHLPGVANQLTLEWGVYPTAMPAATSVDEMIESAITVARDFAALEPGARVVLTAGRQTATPGATNLVMVREIT